MKVAVCYRCTAEDVSEVARLLKKIRFSIRYTVNVSFPLGECEVLFFSTHSLCKLRKILMKADLFRMVATLNKEENYTGESYFFPDEHDV